MADMGWLRRFGQRPKTPSIPGASPEDSEYLSSPSKTMHSPSRRLQRVPAVHRVSSLLSLAPTEHSINDAAPPPIPISSSLRTTQSSNCSSSKSNKVEEHPIDLNSTTSTTAAATGHESPDLFFREADRVWHAPSLDQMIESLQVAMMNKPSALEPLPVRYNGHVLALLEGYAKVKRELEETKRTAAEELEEIRGTRFNELESYRQLSEDWLKSQKDYNAEIKRLELLLAHHTEGGIATVVLARAGSVVDRGMRARKGFEERVKRLSRGDDGDDLDVTSARQAADTSLLGRKSSVYTHIGHLPINLDPNHDRRLSRQLTTKDKKHSHKFSRLAKKYRQHAGEKELRAQHHTAKRDECTDRRHDLPMRIQKQGQHGGPAMRAGYMSSSPSAYIYNTSPSSSDDVGVAERKGVVWMRGSKDGNADSNTEGKQHLRHGALMASRVDGTRNTGDIATENFLTLGTADPSASRHSSARGPDGAHQEVIAEDYFSQPRHRDQRRRARGFSFIAGDDDSLPLSPMALPPPAQSDSDGLTEASTRSWSQGGQAIHTPAPSDISQPKPWSTQLESTGLSVAPRLQQAVVTEASSTNLAPTITTPVQALGHFIAPSVPTSRDSAQSRPASTGSVMYIGGDNTSTAGGCRDSTGSRITVLRDNSGRSSSSRRQSSRSQDTSDVSFESSPGGMPAITEGHRFDPVSPTLSTRGGTRKRSGRRDRRAMSVTTSPPALSAEGADGPPSPASNGRPTPRREVSGAGAGGSEAGAAGQAARIAAALAHARGQKRSSQF